MYMGGNIYRTCCMRPCRLLDIAGTIEILVEMACHGMGLGFIIHTHPTFVINVLLAFPQSWEEYCQSFLWEIVTVHAV